MVNFQQSGIMENLNQPSSFSNYLQALNTAPTNYTVGIGAIPGMKSGGFWDKAGSAMSGLGTGAAVLAKLGYAIPSPISAALGIGGLLSSWFGAPKGISTRERAVRAAVPGGKFIPPELYGGAQDTDAPGKGRPGIWSPQVQDMMKSGRGYRGQDIDVTALKNPNLDEQQLNQLIGQFIAQQNRNIAAEAGRRATTQDQGGTLPPPPLLDRGEGGPPSGEGGATPEEFAAMGADWGSPFAKGGIVGALRNLPKFQDGGEVSGWDMGSWADEQMAQDTGPTGDDLGDQARGMANLGWSPPLPPPILKQPKPLPTTDQTYYDVLSNIKKGVPYADYSGIEKQVYKDKLLPSGPFAHLGQGKMWQGPSRHGIYSEKNIGMYPPDIDIRDEYFFDRLRDKKMVIEPKISSPQMNINPEVIYKDAIDYLRSKGDYQDPDVPGVTFGTDPKVMNRVIEEFLKTQAQPFNRNERSI